MLCVSLFKEFPVGVMILNKTKDNYWLLDGRQRRNAILEMRNNPVNIYDWASTFIGFKKTDDAEVVKARFWAKIDDYLQKDRSEENGEVDTDDINESVEDEEGYSFDPEKQQHNLKVLLDLIIMVHQKRGNVNEWTKAFDFTEYFSFLKYANKANHTISEEQLKKFTLELIKDIRSECKVSVEDITIEQFVHYYYNQMPIDEKKKSKFENTVYQKWDKIQKSLVTLRYAEDIFDEARIGIIWLSNVEPLDAQNIFSLVNRGGTQLKAEELLSAKPFWNVEIEASKSLKEATKSMYELIGTDYQNNVVRWDVAATLLNRVDKNHLVFKTYDESNNIAIGRVTLGFKLLSSIYRKGISAKHVGLLEKDSYEVNGVREEAPIDWEKGIDTLIEDLDMLIGVLSYESYFKNLKSWGKSINDLLPDAIVLEYITIMYLHWKDLDCPRNNSNGKYRDFLRDSLILFDKLIYEHATKVWRGSGDSTMSNHVKNYNSRFDPIPKEAWEDLIVSFSNGMYGNEATTVNKLTPTLYHYYCIKGIVPTYNVDQKYDVDHIIPQDLIRDNQFVDQNLCDCLGNLAVLPKRSNITKSSKLLNKVDDDIKDEVSKFSEVPLDEFDYYSDVTKIGDLKEKRKALFKLAFNENRIKMFSNC